MSARASIVLQSLSDLDLLQRAWEGEPAAAESLMRRHNRVVYRTARAILRDDAEAEDAAQEAWLQAFRAAGGFRGESSVSTWLVRIAANAALMRRRREVRRAEVVAIDAAHGEAFIEQVADEEQARPDAQAWQGEMRRLLEHRIDELPELYRPVFMMRAVEEMTVEETALALGLPEATVRTRFFRARALLRGALERDLDRSIGEVFSFAGERCDRIVARVLRDLAAAG